MINVDYSSSQLIRDSILFYFNLNSSSPTEKPHLILKYHLENEI